MKRYNHLYEKIYDLENLRLAHSNAKKGKGWYSEVRMVDKNVDYYLLQIQQMLINKTYKTSPYKIFTIRERGKEREIYKLPYFPDRIVHWAIMLQIEQIFLNNFIDQTYAALPGRGIHRAFNKLDEYLKKKDEVQYCLKLDIKKFFPSIDNEILKSLFRRKFKDKDLLWLLDEIVDSGDNGVPIGNYPSQYFGNFVLSYFDHWLKEEKGIKYYLRYMDDMVILHSDKRFLHKLRKEIEEYLRDNLRLTVKENWQVFPTFVRGVDFVGYRHFGKYVLLRKSTSKQLKRRMRAVLKKVNRGEKLNYSNWCSINSYKGWVTWCDGYNLMKKYIHPLEPHAVRFYREEVKNENKGHAITGTSRRSGFRNSVHSQ